MMTSIPRIRTAIAALAVAALALAACGSDDDGEGSPGSVGEQDAGAGSDDTGATAPTDTTAGGDTGGGDGEANDLGFCHVTVTGDVEAEWTRPGGGVAVGYGLWYPESMRDPSTPPENTFVINCTGQGNDFVGFTANMSGPGVPMQPATYTFPPDDSSMMGSGGDLPIGLLVNLNAGDTVWNLKSEGSLVITEFDQNHIAGTFTLPMTSGLGGAAGDALVVGEFDLANTYA